jgi:poly(A) polymerase
VAKAVVYTQAEHRIDRSGIDPDALRILERLRENGHEAYLVGGAVRDLLLGRRPKDFDIVTDAQPARIRRIFRSARVIGRRFRLVHVYAGPKIFEVSTFRSIANGTVGNEYGTIDEDAKRRDFSFNALYFDVHDSTLVDYVGGFKDIEAKRVKPVIPLKIIFREDPVRMIRCVKYAAVTGFRIPFLLRHALRRDSSLLAEASPSRLTEEFVKLLSSGKAAEIVKSLDSYNLLRHILPEAAKLSSSNPVYRAALYEALSELDAHASDPEQEKRLALLLAHYLHPFLEYRLDGFVDTPESYRTAVHEARLFLAPLNLPRVELEAAVLVVFKKRAVSPLQRPRKLPPERGAARSVERKTNPRPMPADNQGLSQIDREEATRESGSIEAAAPRKRRRRRRGGGGQTRSDPVEQ